jgi:hypothetical protein
VAGYEPRMRDVNAQTFAKGSLSCNPTDAKTSRYKPLRKRNPFLINGSNPKNVWIAAVSLERVCAKISEVCGGKAFLKHYLPQNVMVCIYYDNGGGSTLAERVQWQMEPSTIIKLPARWFASEWKGSCKLTLPWQCSTKETCVCISTFTNFVVL